MWPILRRVLAFDFGVTELIGIAVIVGVPYLVAGMIWTARHTQVLSELRGIDFAVSILGSIVLWPVLLVTNVCL